MRRFLLQYLLVLVGLFLGSDILAQGISIGITPLVFELTGNPGDVIENQIKISNPSDSVTIGIKITIEDIAPSGEEGAVMVEAAETETYSIASWIKPEISEFTLQPKEEKLFKYTITVPENAEPGGHYGSIIAGAALVSGLQATGATIVPRVGSLILVTIPGLLTEKLTIKEFTTRPYYENGPINFGIRIENAGTVHVRPRGLVTITNWLGEKVAVISFPEKNILPGAIRKFETSWNQKWLWGIKYTATLNGGYGISNSQLDPVVITFWVFPWKAGVGILIIFILFALTRKRWFAAFRVLIRGA